MEKHNSNTLCYQLYEQDRKFKSSSYSNLENVILQAQDFYNGNQYKKNINNQLRVSLNICSFSANIKASKICGTPIYITYTADNYDVDTTKLRQFDEYNISKLRSKSFNFQSALNGFVNGTEVTFIRWDDDDTTYKGIYKGGLSMEHINPLNFAVANNNLPSKDLQNQKWVMFWTMMELHAIKDLIEGKTEKEKKEKLELLIKEASHTDEENIKYEEVSHSMVKVFTRYFRIDGEVYFECQTKHVNLFTYPKPLNRKLFKAKVKKIIDDYNEDFGKPSDTNDIVKDYAIDTEDLIMQKYDSTKLSEEEYKNIKEKFSLYPFALFVPFAVNDSTWGRSDIKSLIPIQKALNYMITMTLKCAENNAYNKILVKPEALKGQVITTEPGQVLVDYSGFTNGWGFKMLETPPVPNSLLDFSDRLLAMSRVIYGFNDVMDGSLTNKDMSGYMLQIMVKQANTAIEQQQQIFWEYNEDLASIRLMFYKHYVNKARFTYEMSDTEYDDEEEARKMMYNHLMNGGKLNQFPNAKPQDFEKPTHKARVQEISGEEMYGANFDISVSAMQGLADSKLGEQQMIDTLFQNGMINQMSPDVLDLYLNISPNISPRQKSAIRATIEKMKRSKISQLESRLQEVVGKTQQIISYCKQLEGKAGYQSEYIKGLTAEFTGKVNTQNRIIDSLMKDLDSVKVKKPPVVENEGQIKSQNTKGIPGGDIGNNSNA